MIHPPRRKRIVVRYHTAGGVHRLVLDTATTSRADTLRAANASLAQVEVGGSPQQILEAECSDFTFADLARDYLELYAKHRKRTWKDDLAMLDRDLLPAWDKRPITEIRSLDIAQLLDGIVSRGAPIRANRVRALASKIFNFALERELVATNPVAAVPVPSAERARARVLSAAEIRILWALWAREASPTATAFQILLLTAQREREILTMRWQDLAGPWWHIPAGFAHRRAHRVFLADRTQRLLAGLRDQTGGSEWVFASPRSSKHIASLSAAHRRYRTLSGIRDWYTHDLRRTAAVHLAHLGLPTTSISHALNYAEPRVIVIDHRSARESAMAHALTTWADYLDQILATQSLGPPLPALPR
jgi:integrase